MIGSPQLKAFRPPEVKGLASHPSRPLEGSERRRSGRRAADFPVLIEEAGGGWRRRRIEGWVTDVSDGGMLIDLPCFDTARELSGKLLIADFRIPPGVFLDPYVRRIRISGRVVRGPSLPESGGPGPCRVALEFQNGLRGKLSSGAWRTWGALGAMLFTLTIGSVLFLKLLTIENFWHAPVLVAYSLGITCYILSRFLLSAFYHAPPETGHRPTVSVVVAAKNEEKAMAKTLERIFESDYPRDLLQVIAIDDGSTDRTFEEMQAVARRHPDLHLIRFPRNLGKRHAMAAGTQVARGEVLVFVDSDSFLERDCLLRLVQGFADPKVAAVAAHGFVQNAWQNALTRMQAVQYYLAFKVLKAAESLFSCVTCCSGCCSAYRRSAVMEVLETWRDQTFMNRPATFGDDRSLTNFMLRKYRVLYDDTAHVATIVPDNLRQFLRQQLRWKKSWLRENVIAASFIWKKPPLMVLSFFAGFIFPVLAPLVVARALLYLPLFGGRVNHLYLWGVFLMSFLYSTYYLMRQRNRMWIYGLLLCVFYTALLTWQLPWALVTSWNNKWGTR